MIIRSSPYKYRHEGLLMISLKFNVIISFSLRQVVIGKHNHRLHLKLSIR